MQPSAQEASAREAGVLEVRGVTVRFGGITALEDVSLTAAPRQVTGIIGPNGAGKTTLLNVLCGLVRPQAGQIRFDGRELTRRRPRHRPDAAGSRPVHRAVRGRERDGRGDLSCAGRVLVRHVRAAMVRPG
jgi:branched-chain amino acid transport system ATP-binding protein